LISKEELSEVYDIVVVIPTLNEEVGISRTINSIKESLGEKYRFKIVVIDGLSTDRTVEVASSMGAKVIRQRRKGYGDALQAGFYFVDVRMKTTVIVMIDADGTYEPRDIVKMADIIISGQADFVIGNRFANMGKEAMTRTNRIGNKILSFVARKLLKIKITDSQCGLRAFRSDLASIFYNSTMGMPFATEMLTAINTYHIRTKEIPTSYYRRVGDTKLNPIQDGTRILNTIIRLVRDTRPLFFFGIFGLFMISLGAFFGIEVLIEYLKTGIVGKIPTTILSVLLIVLGVQSISLGLISDMIKNKNYDKRVFFSE
jgi:glycosyltransferase involved in cell wall biosynthesis